MLKRILRLHLGSPKQGPGRGGRRACDQSIPRYGIKMEPYISHIMFHINIY